jgi:uncharacterized protein (TIGR03086 family)
MWHNDAMSDRDDRYKRVADGYDRILRGVHADQWGLPTPCSDWNVRQLAVHVVETHRRVYSIVDPDGTPSDLGDEDDVIGAWELATSAILSALADSQRAGQLVQTRSGEQPFSYLADGLLSIDTLCHTWDLARATAQNEELDADVVAALHETLLPMDDAIRVPGGFAPKIESADDASEQTKFLNFAGREV